MHVLYNQDCYHIVKPIFVCYQYSYSPIVCPLLKYVRNVIKNCYNLMGRDGPEPMICPLWVAGPIWSCDKNNYPWFELNQIMGQWLSNPLKEGMCSYLLYYILCEYNLIYVEKTKYRVRTVYIIQRESSQIHKCETLK